MSGPPVTERIISALSHYLRDIYVYGPYALSNAAFSLHSRHTDFAFIGAVIAESELV